MNEKARTLNLQGTRFSDSTGLSSANVSTAEDLATLVAAAHRYPLIRDYSTSRAYDLHLGKRTVAFRNTNGLVSNASWDIGLSKTGFINEAGRCLVMQAQFAGRNVIIVLLDSWGKNSRAADASRIRQWLDPAAAPVVRHATTTKAPAKQRRQVASRNGRSA
jgi:D-alanyl-D-alanine endopeptidase (penicillin-binding protein 7)